MKKRTLTRVGFALVASLLLVLSGCSAGAVGAAKSAGGKVAVTVQLPKINPNIYSAMQKASSASSSSRAFMFLSYYYLSATSSTTSTTYYPTDANGYNLYPVYTSGGGSQGPGSSQVVTMNLPPNDYYTFNVSGYNTNESTPLTVSAIQSNEYISSSGSNYVNINLLPASAYYLSYYSGSTSGTANIVESVYNSSNNQFVSTGGEKWYRFSPYDNTVNISVTPGSGYVFAGLYDQNGRWMTAGLSPSFPGGAGAKNITLTSGVTPGLTYYVGLFDTTVGTVANTTKAPDTVSVNVNTPTLTDDAYENNDTESNAAYISSPYSGSPTFIPNLKAYDPDWYYFYAYNGQSYTVTAQNTDSGLYIGSLTVVDPYGAQQGSDYANTSGSGVSTHSATFTTTFTASTDGWYDIGVDLQMQDPNFHFPTVGGGYTLTVSTP